MPTPLPFLVAPKQATRVVTATVNGQDCSIEFPVFGALISGESIEIQEHRYQSSVYAESSRLADQLVADGTAAANLPADTAPELIENEANRLAIRIVSTRMGLPLPLGAAEQRAATRHAALIAQVTDTLNTEYEQLTIRKATAAIRHRLTGCEGWTEDDVRRQVPTPLRLAIAEFIDSEQNPKASDRSAEEMVDEMIDTLGKLERPASPATAEPTPASSSQLQLTGELSTGSAESSGPTPQSSDLSGSDGSALPTSSKRSKKAAAA